MTASGRAALELPSWRAPSLMSGTIMSGWVLPVRQVSRRPLTPRATKGTAGFEFGVLRVINEDGALEEDAITLPSFDPDAGGLYHDAVRLYGHQRHPSSWQAGLDGNATQQRNLDANPDPHRRNTPGSRCKPLDVSGRVCR
jgi:hypothetical protein